MPMGFNLNLNFLNIDKSGDTELMFASYANKTRKIKADANVR